MHSLIFFIGFFFLHIMIQKKMNKIFINFYGNKEHPIIFDNGFNLIPKTNYYFLDDILVILPLCLLFFLKINMHDYFISKGH